MGVRLAGAVLLALLLIPLAGGCSVDEEEAAAERVRTLGLLSGPAGPWQAVKPDLEEPERIAPEPGRTDVWRSGAPATHGVAWSLRLRAAEKEARCAQAARWLVRTGSMLPGEPAQDAAPPTAGKVENACARSLRRADRHDAPGSVGSDSFVSYPDHVEDGNRFGAYLSVRWRGPNQRLVASVLARQES